MKSSVSLHQNELIHVDYVSSQIAWAKEHVLFWCYFGVTRFISDVEKRKVLQETINLDA